MPKKETKPKTTKTKNKKIIIEKSYDKLISLKDTFKELGGDTEKLGLALIDEALFCGDTLMKLRDIVVRDGVITTMCQGDYTIERENPALKSYNTTIKNYQNLVKQIKELLPNQNATSDDGFDDF